MMLYLRGWQADIILALTFLIIKHQEMTLTLTLSAQHHAAV